MTPLATVLTGGFSEADRESGRAIRVNRGHGRQPDQMELIRHIRRDGTTMTQLTSVGLNVESFNPVSEVMSVCSSS